MLNELEIEVFFLFALDLILSGESLTTSALDPVQLEYPDSSVSQWPESCWLNPDSFCTVISLVVLIKLLF